MDELTRHRRTLLLGQRALDYYKDTGLCVFCNADDLAGIPHEDCDVGEVLGIKVTPERVAEKRQQRKVIDDFFQESLFPGEDQDEPSDHGQDG